jgi:CDP-diacylglycerol--glycerol-3-phosphate 3-phosphatidyltransferase
MSDSPRPVLRDIAAPPNLVTLARVLLVPVVLALLTAERRLAAAAVLVLMFATDGLDGYLARRLDRVTELGKVLDPAADKVAVLAVLVFLVAAGEFPLWVLLLVAVRDVGILAGGLAIARRAGAFPPPLMVGKVSLVVFAAVTAVFVADLNALEPAAIALCVFAVVASGASYAVVARRALTTKTTTPA